MKLIFVLLACACAVASPAQDFDYSGLQPPVEMRGIWIDAGAIPKTEAGVRDMVRAYSRTNINILFPEVVMRGYAIWESNCIGRDPRFTGAPDVLAVMIDEAHRHSMEVHPWVWVFRVGYTNDTGSILKAHPEWIAVNKNGETLSANGGYWLDWCNPDARDLIAELFAEMTTRYDIDGLHLDYVRFEVESPTPYGYTDECRGMFEKQYGVDPMDIERLSATQYEWNSFRERLINTFVQRIALQTRALKPRIKMSAAVGSSPLTARLNLMQNWPYWAANKWVDFLTPMAYTDRNESFVNLMTLQQEAAAEWTLLMPGIGQFIHKDTALTVEQVGLARRQIMAGEVMFASSYFKEPHMTALAQGPWARPAAQPFRDPAEKSLILTDLALSQDDPLAAEYYSELADYLARYDRYLRSPTRWIAPTRPPLNIPEVVVELPEVSVPRLVKAADGSPDWSKAASVRLLYTAAGADASVETTAYLVYDDQALHVAFRAQEPRMDGVKTNVTNHDGPTFYDDSAEIFIGPMLSQSDYFHFSTNLLATRFEQRVFNAGWNADWRSSVTRGTNSFTIEMTIPFAAMGVPAPTPGTKWAANLTRNRTVTGELEHITWAVPYGSFHTPDRFGTLVFE